MALQGTLRDFSITEIIQLIGQQLKTGILKIHRGKNSVEIYFLDGMVVHVFSNYRGKKDLIGEILVKAQLITEEQLERVLRIQRETLKYLGEILVELQLLTKDDVLKVLPSHEEEKFVTSRFELIPLSPDTVLLTYFLERENLEAKNKSSSVRSSIWRMHNGKWQMIFHQGTPVKVV